MIRPRGSPPMPRAASSVKEPVRTTSTFMEGFSPNFMTALFPNCFSICAMAFSSAFFLSVTI
jgi:hypothetical protein